MKKILFVDRDGTLIQEPPDQQIDDLSKFKLVDDAILALRRLVDGGWRLVMVTNQDGLGGPGYPQSSFDVCQSMLVGIFQSQGLTFDEVLICPHLPEENCECRKPRLGLLVDYLKDSTIDWSHSYVIGDRSSDMELAKNLKIKGFLISGGGLSDDQPTHSWQSVANQILSVGRSGSLIRKTTETQIEIAVAVDEYFPAQIKTDLPFFTHMLEQLGHHSGWGLKIKAHGDIEIDAHHTIEDTAIVLARAVDQALSDRHGITRYGFSLPMDEASCRVEVDLARRPYFVFDAPDLTGSVGTIDVKMFEHFFRSFALELPCNLHISVTGRDNHHMVESMFKGFARALSGAVRGLGGGMAGKGHGSGSTKGVL